MKRAFIKKEAAKVLDITPRTIQFYTDDGLIIPEIANPTGRGTTRKYSKRNLIELLLIRELAKNGLSLEKIKNVMTELRTKYDNDFLNPEGAWEKMKERDHIKLLIYDAGNDNPFIKVSWKETIKFSGQNYSSAIIVKVGHLFEKVRHI